MIVDTSTPRSKRPLGKITKTFPDSEDLVRTVLEKLKMELLKDPVENLLLSYLLLLKIFSHNLLCFKFLVSIVISATPISNCDLQPVYRFFFDSTCLYAFSWASFC